MIQTCLCTNRNNEEFLLRNTTPWTVPHQSTKSLKEILMADEKWYNIEIKKTKKVFIRLIRMSLDINASITQTNISQKSYSIVLLKDYIRLNHSFLLKCNFDDWCQKLMHLRCSYGCVIVLFKSSVYFDFCGKKTKVKTYQNEKSKTVNWKVKVKWLLSSSNHSVASVKFTFTLWRQH